MHRTTRKGGIAGLFRTTTFDASIYCRGPCKEQVGQSSNARETHTLEKDRVRFLGTHCSFSHSDICFCLCLLPIYAVPSNPHLFESNNPSNATLRDTGADSHTQYLAREHTMLSISRPLSVYCDQSIHHRASDMEDYQRGYCLESCKNTSIPAKCCRLCIARSKWQCQPGRDVIGVQRTTLSLSAKARALLCLGSATMVTVILGTCKLGSSNQITRPRLIDVWTCPKR